MADRPKRKLEEVFKVSGVPTYTFVRPTEYSKLLVSLRTPGRGLVIEGPSGIGKTSAVSKVLEELGMADSTQKLTPRRPDHMEYIAALPSMSKFGTVIIDDFHRLDDGIQRAIADQLKVLADEEDTHSKLVLVGINRAANSLVKFSPDLNNRIDTLRLEIEPDDKLRELIKKGEEALNIEIQNKENIITAARGSFHITQLLAQTACVLANVLDEQETRNAVTSKFETVNERVFEELERQFSPIVRDFAAGKRLRADGRAPYLRILNWLATGNEMFLDLDAALRHHPTFRGSVGQVVDKHLSDFLSEHDEIAKIVYYNKDTRILSVEDPKLIYYLRNISWSKFARDVGFSNQIFESRYDFALSFAGADRELAETLFEMLSSNEVEVFYDKNEQSRILAEDVEEYLGPIYKSEAEYVVALLGPAYPTRIWTKFESDQFKKRFGDKRVIPIMFTTAPLGMFDEARRYGGATFDPSKPLEPQATNIVDCLMGKLAAERRGK